MKFSETLSEGQKTPFDVEQISSLEIAKRYIKMGTFKMNDTHSLSHTKRNCKCHITSKFDEDMWL